MSAHTPGPWSVSNGNLIRVNANGFHGACVCGVHKIGKFNGATEDVALANARLIAAAPDLLDALKKARQFIANGIELGFIRMPDASTPDSAHETLTLIRSVIAKAEARSLPLPLSKGQEEGNG